MSVSCWCKFLAETQKFMCKIDAWQIVQFSSPAWKSQNFHICHTLDAEASFCFKLEWRRKASLCINFEGFSELSIRSQVSVLSERSLCNPTSYQMWTTDVVQQNITVVVVSANTDQASVFSGFAWHKCFNARRYRNSSRRLSNWLGLQIIVCWQASPLASKQMTTLLFSTHQSAPNANIVQLAEPCFSVNMAVADSLKYMLIARSLM